MLDMFMLFICFQIKHFMCDYPLQNTWMALGKGKQNDWVKPLLAHSGVHAFCTLIIVSIVNVNFWWLAIVDFIIHFTMDRIKASPNILNRFTPQQNYFWWCLGFDQMVHHLTHYYIIYMLVK